MIILNGVKLAENKQEMINSLFSIQTCSGYATRLKRQIKIFNHKHDMVGVINRYGVICHARKIDNGNYWYTYADINLLGNNYSLKLQKEDIERYAIHKEYIAGETLYTFK